MFHDWASGWHIDGRFRYNAYVAGLFGWEKPMVRMTPKLAALALLSSATAAGGANAADGQSLEELIKKFQSDAPKVEAEVRIDAWVEPSEADGQPDEMVITILPEGKTKLNADPGITITPADQVGIEWQVALPHRHQDQTVSYFEPPATIRMPFTASDDQPAEILVEYAYCLVDYQCFFGEETLSVVMPAEDGAS
jgi:hypothetical protein